MKAALCTAYGPPEALQIGTAPDPRPGNDEVCIRLFAAAVTASDCVLVLKELAEAGEIRPVIDRRYPLDEIVEAHRNVDLGHKKGNMIVTVA